MGTEVRPQRRSRFPNGATSENIEALKAEMNDWARSEEAEQRRQRTLELVARLRAGIEASGGPTVEEIDEALQAVRRH